MPPFCAVAGGRSRRAALGGRLRYFLVLASVRCHYREMMPRKISSIWDFILSELTLRTEASQPTARLFARSLLADLSSNNPVVWARAGEGGYVRYGK